MHEVRDKCEGWAAAKEGRGGSTERIEHGEGEHRVGEYGDECDEGERVDGNRGEEERREDSSAGRRIAVRQSTRRGSAGTVRPICLPACSRGLPHQKR